MRTSLKKYNTIRLNKFSEQICFRKNQLIADRYKVIENLSAAENDIQLYNVEDILTPKRCTNCSSIIHSQSEEFCENCGYAVNNSLFSLIQIPANSQEAYSYFLSNKYMHSNIIACHDMFYFQGYYFIVSRKINPIRIKQIFSSLNFQQIVLLIQQLVAAVNYLHEHNIFNVNLKLDHIFFDNNTITLYDMTHCILSTQNIDQYIEQDIQTLINEIYSNIGSCELTTQQLKIVKQIMASINNSKNFSEINSTSDEFATIIASESRPGKKMNNTDILVSGTGTNIAVGKASDVGIVRKLNEDSIATFEFTHIMQSISQPFGLFVVADGMGGHDAGEEASRIAIETITRQILSNINEINFSNKNIRGLIESAVFEANNNICEFAAINNNNMGTTVTLAFVMNQDVYIMNVGDTRTYLYSKKKLKLITHDHSLVYRLFRLGHISYGEIPNHPQSNQILCALGDPDLKTSLENMEKQAKQPYFFKHKLKNGDGLLLCSDGLWQMIPENNIKHVLETHTNPQKAVDILVNKANENGGHDNISIIYVKINS